MAFDIKPSKMLNGSGSSNYVFAPSKNICNVQIFDEISMESCNEMIGHMAEIIAKLPSKKPIETVSKKITSPYDVSPDIFVFDVAIDSPGGELYTCHAIASMFALAKSRGAIVRTHNVSEAASAASILAIQGTPGYRIMSDMAFNLVHNGSNALYGERANELDIKLKKAKEEERYVLNTYLTYTKLTKKEYDKCIRVEGYGHMFANKCLRLGFCDWILTHDGRLIGRQR